MPVDPKFYWFTLFLYMVVTDFPNFKLIVGSHLHNYLLKKMNILNIQDETLWSRSKSDCQISEKDIFSLFSEMLAERGLHLKKLFSGIWPITTNQYLLTDRQ